VSLGQTNTQKVALQREPAVGWKVHIMRKVGQGSHKPYSWSVGGSHLDHRLCASGVRGISIPIAHEWLKSSFLRLSEKSHDTPRDAIM
jgi:hypothetical protein